MLKGSQFKPYFKTFFNLSDLNFQIYGELLKKIVTLQKGPGKDPYFWKIELELYDSTNLKKNISVSQAIYYYSTTPQKESALDGKKEF